ncbi:Nif3-like dinuclear metal center hexameric protein, partial [Bacillus vallismortis]|nr:Nif3-like dinuclear metal center hexameric protein [Bacillus vallismortis]
YAEKVMKEGVTRKLTSMCKDQKLNVNIFVSETDTNPFAFL